MVRAWIIANSSQVRDICIRALVASVEFVRDFATPTEDGPSIGYLNPQLRVARNAHRKVAFMPLYSPKTPRIFRTRTAVQTKHSWLLALTSRLVVMTLKTKNYSQVAENTCLVTTITHVLTLAPRRRAGRWGKKRSGPPARSAAHGSLIITAITVAMLWLSLVTGPWAYRNHSGTNHVPSQHPFLPARPWIRSLQLGLSEVILMRSSFGQTYLGRRSS